MKNALRSLIILVTLVSSAGVGILVPQVIQAQISPFAGAPNGPDALYGSLVRIVKQCGTEGQPHQFSLQNISGRTLHTGEVLYRFPTDPPVPGNLWQAVPGPWEPLIWGTTTRPDTIATLEVFEPGTQRLSTATCGGVEYGFMPLVLGH